MVVAHDCVTLTDMTAEGDGRWLDRPNLERLREIFGSDLVCVADCCQRHFSDQVLKTFLFLAPRGRFRGGPRNPANIDQRE